MTVTPIDPQIKGPATNDRQTFVFLLFLFLALVGETFISNAFKFVAFELTQSFKVVTLVGSLSACAFITVGLFAGIIVDAISRRLFAIFHLLTFALLSVIIFGVYEMGWLSIYGLFLFIIVHEISLTFHKAAKTVIFFDFCGSEHLARWISRRSIVLTAASMTSSLILSYFVASDSFLFVIYCVILLAAYLIFRTLEYEDRNQKHEFTGVDSVRVHLRDRFREFILVSRQRRALLFLFVFSFVKTFFIFWPMASGALFKFGIENDETRRLYLLALIAMDFLTILSLYLLGNKKNFTVISFLVGCTISGVGIFLFALVEGLWLNIITLAVMYVGLAISQVSSSYVLRVELPVSHRAQGLSFAVVPYYAADIFSGLVFAGLLSFFDVSQLLFFAGAGLLLTCALALPLAMRWAKSSISDEVSH